MTLSQASSVYSAVGAAAPPMPALLTPMRSGASELATSIDEAIPALSRATGANAIPEAFSRNNKDMMTLKNGWPAGRMNSDHKLNNWLHGDFRDVGYFFVYRLYDDICTRGVLR